MMKTCYKCKEEKLFADFYKDSSRGDGISSICKICCAKRKKAYYEQNKEKVLHKTREWKRDNRESVLKKQRAYYKSEKGKSILRKAYERRVGSPHFKKQTLAKRQVFLALRRGDLKKGKCAHLSKECEGRVEGHHCDYNKPLEVMWLCVRHHKLWHKKNTPIY